MEAELGPEATQSQMAAHGKIFVSYRRDDAPGDARSVYERLGRIFGEKSVFMDVDQLLAGQRFDRELDKALAECDVLIAVIGARWTDLLSEYAQQGKRDYVRDEIAAALQRDIIVIPVMVGREANMPPLPLAEELPENIRDLVLYQKHNIAHESFGRDTAHLIAALQSLLRERRAPKRWQAITVAGLIGLAVTVGSLGYGTGPSTFDRAKLKPSTDVLSFDELEKPKPSSDPLAPAQLKDSSVSRGWIGVQIQPVTQDIADSLGLEKAEGALVAEPQANSPAAKAGIESGDVITAVNGETVKDSRELARTIGGIAPGTAVKLNVLHKGTDKLVNLTLGQLPNTIEAKADNDNNDRGGVTRGTDVPKLGLTVAPASSVAGAGKEGVVVTEVDPKSAAAERGFKEGDVILEVAGKTVASVGDVRDAISAARNDNRNSVLMRVKSGGQSRFVAVPVG
jgi:hypothetical protein